MPVFRLPVRPDLKQLQRQAKELLSALHAGDADAIGLWREHQPESGDPGAAKLTDAQFVLARGYQASSWTRLVHAVKLAEAIWRDDLDEVSALIKGNKALLHEDVLIRADSNWGPPMTYAANLGRDRIIRFLHSRGAKDLEPAAGRAALQGKTDTVRLIYELAGKPSIENWSLAGPAYTLSVEGTAVLFALGAHIVGPEGVDTNAMEHLLGTDSRNPAAKRRIVEMWVEHGFEPPDTPMMAFHRGRIDLLEAHLARDPDLLTRTFDIADVFPLAPACARDPYTAQGTPVHATTLLHLAAYFDDVEIGEWLLDHGMDPDARAAVDGNGFGGYTALFSTVVSQRNFWVNYGKGQPDEARFTKLLLARGANPNIKASIRARLEEGHGGGPAHDYRDVTPFDWGEQSHAKIFVSRESLRLIEASAVLSRPRAATTSQLFLFPTAVRNDPSVDAWMRERAGELGAFALRWFEVMRGCGDDVRELLHDGHPTACVDEAAFAYVDAFSAHVNVGFFRGAEIVDPDGLLEGTGKLMRHVKLRQGQGVDATALENLIKTAYADMKRRLQPE